MGIQRTKKDKSYNLDVKNDLSVENSISSNDIDAIDANISGTLNVTMFFPASYYFATDKDSRRAIYSTDTITWTTVTIPQYNSRGYRSVIDDGNDNVVAAPHVGQTAIHSKDLVNWTASTLPAEVSNAQYQHISYGNNVYIAYVNSISYSQVAISTNLITWTLVDFFPSYKVGGIIHFYNNKFISSALNPSDYVKIVVTSTDAITWTQSTVPDITSVSAVHVLNNNYVVIGYNNNDYSYKMCTSTDAITWTTLTSNQYDWYGWPSRTHIYVDGKYIVYPSDSYTSNYAYSTNLINWTTSSVPGDFGGVYEMTFAYGDGQLVAFGYNRSNAYVSTDAITWTARSLGVSNWRFGQYCSVFAQLTPPALYPVGEKLQELIEALGLE